MKILIEEKDETQTYRPAPIDQLFDMVKLFDDKVVIYVPNMCGGETRITIFRSEIPNGNTDNIDRLKKIAEENIKKQTEDNIHEISFNIPFIRDDNVK